ncbi:excisionase [Enterobacter ludwigii]|nr:excisionase [Enterobacter asburiae]
MLLTLKEWASDVYQDPPPIGTLQRWARNGNIYPPPEKHGREYKVQHDAFYIKPNKACSKIQHQNPNGRTGKKSSLLERIEHEQEIQSRSTAKSNV